MNNTFNPIRNVVTTVLLLIYAGTAAYMIFCVASAAAGEAIIFPSGIVNVATVVGGLVSAYVVAMLSLAKPGATPVVASSRVSSEATDGLWGKVIDWTYLGIWFLAGLAALIVGTVLHPDTNQTVSDLGMTWLGILVTAGYAYAGIQPPPAKPVEAAQKVQPAATP